MHTKAKEPAAYHKYLGEILSDVVNDPLLAASATSTTVASFLSKINSRIVWVRLTKETNSPLKFWESFAGALSKWDDSLGKQVSELGFCTAQKEMKKLAQMIARSACKETRVVFVVDNYHHITDASVKAFVESLLAADIENTSIVLLAGESIGFDADAFSKNSRQARGADRMLRFTPEEALDYYLSLGINISIEQTKKIHDFTKGWAFGIFLVGIYLEKSKVMAEDPIAYAIPLVFDMLDKNVFSVYPKYVQQLIIALSLLDDFSPDLVRELVPKDANLFLEFLKNNLFVSYNPYSRSYYFHHLFQEFLAARRAALSKQCKTEIYRKAAAWHEARGAKLEAISYYKKSGDYNKVLFLIKRFGNYRLTKDLASRFIGILEDLPQEFCSDHPMVEFTKANMYFNNMEPAVAQKMMTDLQHRLESIPKTQETKAILGEIYAAQAIFLFADCDYKFISYFQKASEYLPNGSTLFVGDVRFLGNANAITYTDCGPGALEKMQQALFQAMPYAEKVLNGCGCGLEYLAAAEAAFYTGNLKLAEKNAFQAIYKARNRSQWDIVCSGFFLLMRISFSGGKYSYVNSYLAQLQEYGLRIQGADFFCLPDIASGWYQLKLGHIHNVAKWIRDDTLNNQVVVPMSVGRDRLLKAYYLLSADKYYENLAFLEESIALCRKKKQLPLLLELQIVKAITCNSLGEAEKAVRELQNAYDMACHNNIIMPFVEYGNQMRSLIDCARSLGNHEIPAQWLDTVYSKANTYVKRQAYIKNQFDEEHNLSKSPAEKLSRREKEVLENLCQGLTREEIAENCCISVNTVKSLIQNLYNKLGATNRADAVRTATMMNLDE